MNKWQKISLTCGIVAAGLILFNIFYITPRLAEQEIVVKIWGCAIDNIDCLNSKTNAQEITASSSDNLATAQIPANTLLQGTDVHITPVDAPVEQEPSLGTFGRTYSITTESEYFLNYATIKISYQEDEIPPGVEEKDLILARWDGGSWAPVASVVDTENNFIIAKRDKFSNHTKAYGERRSLQGKNASGRISVQGKFQIDGVGAIKKARFHIFQDTDGGVKKWIGITGLTNEEGEYSFTLPQSMEQKLKDGKIHIKIMASNPMVVVKSARGVVYNTTAWSLDSTQGYDFSIEMDEETKDAFRTLHRLKEIRDGYLEMIDNFQDPELKAAIQKAVNSQITLNYLVPNNEGTEFEPHASLQDVINISEQNRKVEPMADGDGDTLAHEYAHYLTRVFYGYVGWNRLTLSPFSKVHEIGDVVSPRLGFAEDIAYFLESVFDGKKHEDLVRANPYERRKQAEESLYGKNGWVTNFQDAIGAAMDNPSKINELFGHLQVFVRFGNQTLEGKDERQGEIDGYNTFIRKYNPALNETPKQIDGQGANILYDLLESDKFGENRWTRLEKIMSILLDKEPKGIQDFYDAWVKRYSYEENDLKELCDSYGWLQEIPTLPPLNWEQILKQIFGNISLGEGGKNLTQDQIDAIIRAANNATGQNLSFCIPFWQCTDLSDCVDGKQTRTCEDINNCANDQTKPQLEFECCAWDCGDWSVCVDGKQTRTCPLENSCGTSQGKPEETQVCVPAESELVVSAAKTHIEIGEAVSITIKIPSDFAPPFDIYTSVSNGAVVLPSRDLGHTVTGSFTSSNAGKATLYVRVTDANGERVQGGITFTVGCVPDWQCSKWSECQDGEQTQTCWDANECGIDDDKPAETRKCAAYELDLYVAEDGNKVGYRQPAISMPAPRNFVLPLCIQVENSAPHVETMVYFREFIAGPGATQEAPPEFDELGCDFISKYESSQVWGEVDQAGTTTVTVTMTDAELRTAQGVVDVHTSCDIACECEKACFDSVGDALFENAEHYKRSWPEMITNRQEFYDCCDNCPLSACTRGETCHYWWQ